MGDDDTELTPTQEAQPPELAWSTDETQPITDYRERRWVTMVFAPAAAVGIGAIAAVVLMHEHEKPQPALRPLPSPTTVIAAPPTVMQTVMPTQRVGLPGTDDQGFVGSFARCDAGSTAAFTALTNKAQVVVCQTGPASYYYRAEQMSDKANIELPNAVRTSGGWDVTDPADGTRREVRPTVVRVISPNGNVDTEPVVGSAPPATVTQTVSPSPSVAPMSLTGKWSGPVSGDQTGFDVVADIVDGAQLTGTVSYPQLNCAGIWKGRGSTANGIRLVTETITQGNCVTSEITLAPQNDGTLYFRSTYYAASEQRHVTIYATLRR